MTCSELLTLFLLLFATNIKNNWKKKKISYNECDRASPGQSFVIWGRRITSPGCLSDWPKSIMWNITGIYACVALRATCCTSGVWSSTDLFESFAEHWADGIWQFDLSRQKSRQDGSRGHHPQNFTAESQQNNELLLDNRPCSAPLITLGLYSWRRICESAELNFEFIVNQCNTSDFTEVIPRLIDDWSLIKSFFSQDIQGFLAGQGWCDRERRGQA